MANRLRVLEEMKKSAFDSMCVLLELKEREKFKSLLSLQHRSNGINYSLCQLVGSRTMRTALLQRIINVYSDEFNHLTSLVQDLQREYEILQNYLPDLI